MNKGEGVFLQFPNSKSHPLVTNGLKDSSNPFPACLCLCGEVFVDLQLLPKSAKQC